MAEKHRLDEMAVRIASLNETELIDRIKTFHGRFRLDFTDEYLNSQSPDKLRHILLAAVMTDFKDAG